MSVIMIKPYTYQVYSPDTYVADENGNPVLDKENSGWSALYECDVVQSSTSASEITLEDGSKVAYNHTLYGKAESPAFVYGQKIRIYDTRTNKVFFEGEVKGWRNYQLQTKIWV